MTTKGLKIRKDPAINGDPAPCELGCEFRDYCTVNNVACMEFHKYTSFRYNSFNGVSYPEECRTPTERIYSLIFTDGEVFPEKTFRSVVRKHIERWS